jgi:hypothetical protein
MKQMHPNDDPTEDLPTQEEEVERETTKRRKRKRKRKSKEDAVTKENPNNDNDNNHRDDTDHQIPAAEDQQQQKTLAEVDRTVYIEGIPFSAQPEHVKEFFQKEIATTNPQSLIVDCRLPVWHDSGRLR